MQKYTLIITEKPDAAQRIATALDNRQQPERHTQNGIPYYTAERDKQLVIVPAIGHLYTVTQQKKGSNYPVFEFHWTPRYRAEKKARQTKQWLEAITKLAENADTFIDACDYDIEGSLIGYNILNHACNGKDQTAKRMKYSTLIAEELVTSYQNLSPHLDFPLIEAGRTRHEVDWLYGINLTRALTNAYKKHTRKYQILSTGRVQGPTLKFLTTREKTIANFTPTTYWQIKAKIQINQQIYEAQHTRNPFQAEIEASTILDKCRGKPAFIQKIETKQHAEKPPFLFDLGTLQAEAYRFFGYNPKRTLDIAQKLYLNALISYPRTNSQQLPPAINHRTILQNLNHNPGYRTLANQLLNKKSLYPTQGPKTDPAHPAIHPTGKRFLYALTEQENNILDLVIHRFLSTFAENALRQTVTATIKINDEYFILNGKQTIRKGWIYFYQPYTRIQENPLPPLQEGQQIKNKAIISQKNYTKPPPRYNPATLLRKMEQAGIGTKATRANIVQTLYNRKYIHHENIQPTNLGTKIAEILKKHCPTITSTKLTRQIEEQMAKIQNNTETRQNVLETTIQILKPVTEKLKQNEETTGIQLQSAMHEMAAEQRAIGACPNCKTGSLIIVYSKSTHKRFIGCTNYFNHTCTTSAPIPQRGPIKPTHRHCATCSWPTIQTRTRANHTWILCLNPACPQKNSKTQTKPSTSTLDTRPSTNQFSKPLKASIGKSI